MSQEPEIIEIYTENIRLDAFLKLSATVQSGGEAKSLVQGGFVQVNGETCTQRTKKLRPGDTVSTDAGNFRVGGGAK